MTKSITDAEIEATTLERARDVAFYLESLDWAVKYPPKRAYLGDLLSKFAERAKEQS